MDKYIAHDFIVLWRTSINACIQPCSFNTEIVGTWGSGFSPWGIWMYTIFTNNLSKPTSGWNSRKIHRTPTASLVCCSVLGTGRCMGTTPALRDLPAIKTEGKVNTILCERLEGRGNFRESTLIPLCGLREDWRRCILHGLSGRMSVALQVNEWRVWARLALKKACSQRSVGYWFGHKSAAGGGEGTSGQRDGQGDQDDMPKNWNLKLGIKDSHAGFSS